MGQEIDRTQPVLPMARKRAGALVDQALSWLRDLTAQPMAEDARPVVAPSPRAGLRYFLLLDRRLIVPVVVLLTFFCFCFIRQTDPDWWWHLRTGQLIWETRAIPTVDPYSYTNAGRPWVVHEWLFEVLSYLGYQALGYNGSVLVMAVIVLATYTLHYLLLRSLGAGRVLAGLLVLLTTLLTFMAITMRAHIFSALFLSLELWWLYLYRSGSRRALWCLPPLMILWVNLHGAWIMGLGTLGLFIIGEWLNTRTRPPGPPALGEERANLKPALLVLALSTAAIAVNPQGLEIYLFPLSFIGAESATMMYINEWQPPDFRDTIGLAFGLTVMLTVALGLRRPRFDWTLALWALAFTFLGFSAMRHVPLYALVIMPIIVQQLPARWRGPEWPYRENALTGLLNWALALIAVGTTAMVMLDNPLAQVRATPNLETYPVAGLAYLREHPESGNLFNYDGWGGYIIQELYPTRPVFIDTRVDLYGREFLEEYITVTDLKPGWKDVLRRYDIAQVLMPKDSSLVAVLREDPGWRVVLEGDEEVLLARNAD